MPSLNSCNFIGNVTRDPELKYLPNGKPVCDFGIAVNHNYTTEGGEKREEVTFIDCTAFGKTAEIISQYAKKGKSVYVGCRAKMDTWDDKTTGQKRSKLKMIVDNIQLLGSRPEGEPKDWDEAKVQAEKREKQPALTTKVADSDDLPY